MRALLSVYEKRGLAEFARGLVDLGWQVFASGGTAAALREAGVRVGAAEELGGQREALGGRVKTLQAAIHAAVLARRDRPEDMAELQAMGVEPIDLVCVNLYPFVERPHVENIDIGGPALLRAAAKNWAWVAAVSDPSQYAEVLADLRAGGGRPSEPLRRRLALEAFRRTAFYDAAISAWLAAEVGSSVLDFPSQLTLGWQLVETLRYGENPHQRAALYRDALGGDSLLAAQQLQGKALSYNNLLDAQAAWELMWELDAFGPAACAIKHGGPCGAAVGDRVEEAYERCYAADPVSIFGGVVGLTRPVSAALAERLAQTFLEVVLAPSFDEEALAVLGRKKNLRLLVVPRPAEERSDYRLRRIAGGLLVQEADGPREGEWQVVTHREPTPEEWQEMRFAWAVVRHVTSNAIVVSSGRQTRGIGGGQPNRIGAARIAIAQAGEAARGAVLASDGFFPFPDVVEEAARAGVSAIVQPGGSVRDDESIAAANAAGMAMVFTGVRHFKH